MSGRGKGGKGLMARLVAERKAPTARMNGGIRKLARRAGIKRIKKNLYEATKGDRGVMQAYLKTVLSKALIYTKHANRKTVSVADIQHGVRSSQHRELYV